MSNQNPYGYGPPPPSQQPGYPPQQGYPPQYQQPPQMIVVQNTMARQGFNHTPHIVISFLTCGTWLPIYLLIWALSGK